MLIWATVCACLSITPQQRKIIDNQIKQMLDQGVIQHSRSPWNYPFYLVLKKDGNYRPVIDFRRVNQVTQDDKSLLPVLSDSLVSLGQGNTIFSSLYLISAYWPWPVSLGRPQHLVTHQIIINGFACPN